MPTLAVNKQALYEYEILERLEAGIVLSGAETKSIRAGHISLKGSFAVINNRELWLLNAHISRYGPAGVRGAFDPVRSRKLLVQGKQLARLAGQLRQKGLTLLPLSLYTKGTRIKVELGIGRGKRQFEKRELIKKRDAEREMRTALKGRH